MPVTERKVVGHPDGKLLTMFFKSGDNAGFLLSFAADNSFQMLENPSREKISAFARSRDGRRLAFTENQEISGAAMVEGL